MRLGLEVVSSNVTLALDDDDDELLDLSRESLLPRELDVGSADAFASAPTTRVLSLGPLSLFRLFGDISPPAAPFPFFLPPPAAALPLSFFEAEDNAGQDDWREDMMSENGSRDWFSDHGRHTIRISII